MPSRTAPSMSVSSRSPTISGRCAPVRAIVSSSSGRAGLPATSGSTPVKSRSIRTITPWPGAMPNAVGIVPSVLLATQGSPSRTRTAARITSRQTTSGP